jgi:RNA polymerase sigma-70 factor, ECF subfamily
MDSLTRQQLLAFLPNLRRFAMALGGSGGDSDDLVQTTVERALTRIDQWQPGTRLDSWLFRIMHSIHVSQLRHAAVQRRANPNGHGGNGHDHGSNGFDDQSAASAPEASVDGIHIMESKMMLDEVRRAFTQLPDEQRAVMMLVCVEGLAYRQVAEVLDIPIGTVMSRLARARLTLHRLTDRPPQSSSPQSANQSFIGNDNDA